MKLDDAKKILANWETSKYGTISFAAAKVLLEAQEVVIRADQTEKDLVLRREVLEKYIERPISIGFDCENVIGYVTIERKYENSFPEYTIAPGVRKVGEKMEIHYFGFVRTE